MTSRAVTRPANRRAKASRWIATARAGRGATTRRVARELELRGGIGFGHDEHRARCAAQHACRHAAHEQALDHAAAVPAHHHEVGVLPLRELRQPLRRRALDDARLQRDAVRQVERGDEAPKARRQLLPVALVVGRPRLLGAGRKPGVHEVQRRLWLEQWQHRAHGVRARVAEVHAHDHVSRPGECRRGGEHRTVGVSHRAQRGLRAEQPIDRAMPPESHDDDRRAEVVRGARDGARHAAAPAHLDRPGRMPLGPLAQILLQQPPP